MPSVVPTSGSNIRLINQVLWHNDYKNTRWFTSVNEQTNWFMARPLIHSMSQATFQRIEGKHFISVNKSIDDLWGVSYLMFRNTAYNNKWFYAFVTKLEYKQRNTTYVHFEIDVMQTWRFSFNFKPSTIIREHRERFQSNGHPIIQTQDEGVDYGSEYDNVLIENVRLSSTDIKWLVIVAKSPLENAEDNSPQSRIIGIPQPLSYYIIPFRDDGINPSVRINGTLHSLTYPETLLTALYTNIGTVNNVVSIYVTEHTGLRWSDVAGIPNFTNTTSQSISVVDVADDRKVIKVNAVRQFTGVDIDLGDKYRGFIGGNIESKLLMYPYCLIVLDDFRGNRVEYRPEHIKGDNLRIHFKGSLGTSNAVSYAVADYNAYTVNFENAVSNEHALIQNTPSDIPVVNDMLASFLQGNRNSVQNQKNQVIWNGVMDGIGGAVNAGAMVASKGMMGDAGGVISGIRGAGNSILQYEGIQAKQRDIDNMPPSIAKMGSNTAYDYGNGYDGVYVIRKQIKAEYRQKLSHYFQKAGTKSGLTKVPNFRTRTNWNYIQTLDCVITGDFPKDDLLEIKRVFDGGITLWHTDDIGNYLLSNGER